MTKTWDRRTVLGVLAATAGTPVLAFGQAAEPLRPFMIPSGSMEPNLLVGDMVLTRWTGRPGAPALVRGDVIIFRHEERFWCKRLIGLPGDRVSMKDGVPILNGAPLARRGADGLGRSNGRTFWIETLEGRTYRIQHTEANAKRFASRQMREITVPANGVFAMGDNRDDSHDSRAFGPVLIADLRFVAVQILLSRDPTRAGFRLDRNVL